MIYRFHKGKIENTPFVDIWGQGTVRREFLYVDDMADASIHLMNLDREIYNQFTEPMCSHINVGSGQEITIEELAKLIKEVVGYKGQINFDTTKPEGTIRKLLDSKVINSLGWSPKFDLRNGLIKTYEYFLSQ